MKTKAVLLIGQEHKGRVRSELTSAGLEPVVVGRMLYVLEKLRHNDFAAVVLDCDHASVDALECVLNVRDVDSHIPVVIVGDGGDREVLLSQGNTLICGGAGELRDMVSELESLQA